MGILNWFKRLWRTPEERANDWLEAHRASVPNWIEPVRKRDRFGAPLLVWTQEYACPTGIKMLFVYFGERNTILMKSEYPSDLDECFPHYTEYDFPELWAWFNDNKINP